MKKMTICLSVFALSISCASFSLAAGETAIANASSTAGGTVTIAARAAIGTPAFVFEPSTSVNVQGLVASDGSEFAVQTYHESVIERDSGKAFGVTSESNTTYWLDLSGTAKASIAALAVTDDTTFVASWTAM